jgi:teichuronic acid exporter
LETGQELLNKPAPDASPHSAATPPSAGARLDYSLFRSIAWNAAGDWGTQLFTWLMFLVVMRLLTPKDFGIMALAGILIPYMSALTGLGFGRAVIAVRDLTDDQLAQMNTLSIFSAVILFLLGVAIAKPFAAFFKIPAVAPVFIVCCSGLIVGALAGVPGAVMAKEMRFRFLTVLGVTCTMIAAITTFTCAWLGFGYWALLIGSMVSAITRTATILWVRPTRLVWPRLSSLRKPFRFGWRISVAMVALNSYQRLDDFVAGKMLGPTALGFYGNAWELANVPIEKVASLVTTVIPSYFSAVQNDPAALRRYLRVLTEMIALATFPATVGLSLVAPEAVPVIFGHKWVGMVGPLQVLSFYAGFRSIVALLPKLLTSVGQVHFVMWNELAGLVILPVGFYIGSYRGVTGIAWAWVLAYPLVVVPLYRKVFRTIGMSIGEYLRALRPSLTGTILMIPAVEGVRHSLATTGPLFLRLILEVAAGALVYVGTLWLLHRERVIGLVRSVWNLRLQKTRLVSEPIG